MTQAADRSLHRPPRSPRRASKAWMTSSAAASPGIASIWSRVSPARARPRSPCSSSWRDDAAARAVLYITLSETEDGAARRGRLARLVAGRGRDPRADPQPGQPRAGAAVHDVPSLGDRAGRDHTRRSGRDRAHQALAHRVRLALGAAAAGGQLAALPPTGPGAQAVLCRTRLHRAAARRSHRRRPRSPDPEHRAWRGAARPDPPGVRSRAAAPARDQVSRPVLPRRLPRFRHPARRAGGLPAHRGLGAPRGPADHPAGERHSRSSTRCWAAASRAARAR